jgi:tRNA (mo5U34)-methyltransferase
MTKDELEAGVARLAPWFHQIDLGQGVKTKSGSQADEPADHPRPTFDLVARSLPADLRGQAVLDVGCNGGFYAVEMKKRGAGRVLAIDSQRHHVRQTAFVARALGLDLETARESVYDLSPARLGEFDLTLALGLVYHLKHLVLALERLFLVTRGTLIVESGILPRDRFPEPFPHTLGGHASMLHPLAYVENPAQAKEAAFNWFLPHPQALRALLRNVGFDPVEVAHEDDKRAILVARRPPASTTLAMAGLRARLELLEAPSRVRPGAELLLRVRVENEGSTAWPAEVEPPPGPVKLGAHLIGADETDLDWDYGRATLPRDLKPGDGVTLSLALLAPTTPGAYFIEMDMVAEHLTWFEDLGSATVRHRVAVE